MNERICIKNGDLFFSLKKNFEKKDILISEGNVLKIADDIDPHEGHTIIDARGKIDEDKGGIKRETTGVIEFDINDTRFLKKQKTVGRSNIFYGIGLHSGVKTGMTIQPLPPGRGIRFENISEPGFIPARIEFLDTSAYATSIRKDNLEAKTIEHFMATLHAAGITDTLCAGLFLLGLGLQSGLTLDTFKLFLIFSFFFFTSPTATHALAKAALLGKLQPVLDDDPQNGKGAGQ